MKKECLVCSRSNVELRLKRFTILGIVILDYICKECFEMDDEDDFGDRYNKIERWDSNQNN